MRLKRILQLNTTAISAKNVTLNPSSGFDPSVFNNAKFADVIASITDLSASAIVATFTVQELFSDVYVNTATLSTSATTGAQQLTALNANNPLLGKGMHKRVGFNVSGGTITAGDVAFHFVLWN
jgi:hypothetical protein